MSGGRRRRASPRRPLALLLTHSGDFFTIDRVEAALAARGWDAVRFDTDAFPTRVGLTVERTASGLSSILELPERQLRLEDVEAIWLRRLWPPQLPEAMAARDRAACADACHTALFDALAHLTAARWVNRLEASMRAESKLLQLSVAHRLGLTLPDTTVTNSPAWVERLRRRAPRVVTKLLVPLSYAMQSERFVYTSELTEEHLGGLSALRWAPQIFQPLVEKARELRVIVVGRELFAAAIDASGTRRGSVDWRRLDSSEAVPWVRASVPPAVRRQIFALLKALDLESGALDFIVTRDGEHVFLEVNPAGEWGWLERDLGYDISGAFARALIKGVRRT